MAAALNFAAERAVMADLFVSHTSNNNYWVGAIGKELTTLGPVAHVHETGDAAGHRLSATGGRSLACWVKGAGPFMRREIITALAGNCKDIP